MIGRTQHTNEVLLAALRAALRNRVTVDKNLVDAFTANLAEAGVDLWALDELCEDADALRIEEADALRIAD